MDDAVELPGGESRELHYERQMGLDEAIAFSQMWQVPCPLQSVANEGLLPSASFTICAPRITLTKNVEGANANTHQKQRASCTKAGVSPLIARPRSRGPFPPQHGKLTIFM